MLYGWCMDEYGWLSSMDGGCMDEALYCNADELV